MGRRSIRKRAAARASDHASIVRVGRVDGVSTARPDKTCARKAEARECKASACDWGFSDARSQEAELQRLWRIATLLDHHDGDDDDLLSSTRNEAFPRAGFANLGNTCFFNAAVQALARPLLVSRCELEEGTLAAQAAGNAALHAVLPWMRTQALLVTILCHVETPRPYALSTPAPATPWRRVFNIASANVALQCSS